ncbi:MAG: 4Fe-4S dicluster domain-containing protein [Acidobacteriota bacterium]
MAHRALLVDITKCIGCGACCEGCQKANGQPAHEARKFDEDSFTYLMDRGSDTFVRRLCMHCEHPTCVSVCPVAALRKTAQGPVVYEPERCMGCRYCMMACPYNVPTYEWHSAVPRVRKCQMCAGRTAGSACAEACPTGATIQGERDALIAEARKRLADDPETYYPHIFGLTEGGGTSVLYIGPKSPVQLGLPLPPADGPLPDLTWRVLRHVPDVGIFGSVLLGGFWWLTRRKDEVAAHERTLGGDTHD